MNLLQSSMNLTSTSISIALFIGPTNDFIIQTLLSATYTMTSGHIRRYVTFFLEVVYHTCQNL